MKVKTPKAKEVVEDPAVVAQRNAAEKAAEEASTIAVSDRLRKKTRIIANVFGGPSSSIMAASTAASGSSGSSGAPPTSKSTGTHSGTNSNGTFIPWKGGMF